MSERQSEPLSPLEAAIAFAIREAARLRRKRLDSAPPAPRLRTVETRRRPG